jgi:hypothetical protein
VHAARTRADWLAVAPGVQGSGLGSSSELFTYTYNTKKSTYTTVSNKPNKLASRFGFVYRIPGLNLFAKPQTNVQTFVEKFVC